MLPIMVPLALAGIKGVESYLSYKASKANAPVPFEKTAYGKYLAGVAETGSISPLQQHLVKGGVASEAARQAAAQKAALSGRLVATGVGDSIATQKLFADIGTHRADAVATTARQLALQNELSKVGAAEKLASSTTAREDYIKRYNEAATQQLIGGIGDTLTTAVGDIIPAIVESKETNQLKQDYQSLLNQYGISDSSSITDEQMKTMIDNGDWAKLLSILERLAK